MSHSIRLESNALAKGARVYGGGLWNSNRPKDADVEGARGRLVGRSHERRRLAWCHGTHRPRRQAVVPARVAIALLIGGVLVVGGSTALMVLARANVPGTLRAAGASYRRQRTRK